MAAEIPTGERLMKREWILAAAFASAIVPAVALAADAPLTAGEVKKVDREAKKLTIKHGPIVNLRMPPMTMVFRVKDAALLEGLESGAQIRFRAEEADGGYLVTRLEKAKAK
jgi:Cu/Ag efflux protein CusF